MVVQWTLTLVLLVLPAAFSDTPVLREPETPAIVVHKVLTDRIEVTVRDVFSSEQDLEYSVVVTTDPDDPDLTEMKTLHTWRQVGSEPGVKKSYMAMPPCRWFFTFPSNCYGLIPWGKRGRARRHAQRRRHATRRRRHSRKKRATVTFTVGGGDCRYSATADHCNGPLLEPGKYYLALRGFSAFGGFADSAFTKGIDCEGAHGAAIAGQGDGSEGAEERSSTENVVLLVLAIIAFLLLVCAIAVVVFIFCRRRRANQAVSEESGAAAAAAGTTGGETGGEASRPAPRSPRSPSHNYYLRSVPHTCVQEPGFDNLDGAAPAQAEQAV